MRVCILTRAISGLIAVFLASAQVSSAQDAQPGGTYVYPASDGAAIAHDGRNFGVVDGAGRVIHPFQYERIDAFSDAGFAAAVRRIPNLPPASYNGWGVIDRKGKVVLPFNFTFINMLSDGKIAAIDRVGKQRLFDASGREFVTPPGFTEVKASSTTEFMIVSDAEGLRTVTTRDGRPIIPGRYDEIVLYPEINVATAYDAENDEEIAFDLASGKQISDRGYSSISFIGGAQSGFQRRWIIHGGLESDSPARITDFSGKPLGAGRFEGAGIAKDGLFVLKQGGRWGVLHENATVIVPFKVEIEEYIKIEKGKISAKIGAGWGQVDYTGKILTPFEFISWVWVTRDRVFQPAVWVNPFHALSQDRDQSDFEVLKEEKTDRLGVMDAQNQWVIPVGTYEDLRPVLYRISETGSKLAAIKKDGRWGFFDLTQRREVMVPQIEGELSEDSETSSFSGFSLVRDKAGKHSGLIEFKEFEFKKNAGGLAFTQYIRSLDAFIFLRGTYVSRTIIEPNCVPTGLMGVMRRDGSVLVEPKYEVIKQAGINKGEPELFYATRQGKAGFLDTSGNIVIPFNFRPLTDETGCHTNTFFHKGHINIGFGNDVALINAKGEVIARSSDFMLTDPELQFTLFEFAGRKLPGMFHGPEEARMIRFNLGDKFYDTPSNDGARVSAELFNDDNRARSEQLLLVRRNGKWGYLDPSGREAIPPVYDNASVFRQGVAYVQQGGNFEAINRSGAVLQHYDPAVARMRRSKVWQQN